MADMLRVIQEDKTSLEVVEANFRQYVPKSVYKKYSWFLKGKIHQQLQNLLGDGRKRDPKFVKEQYLSQVEELAPSYLCETFHALTFKEEEYPSTIRIDPYHTEHSGVSVAYIGKNNVKYLLYHAIALCLNKIQILAFMFIATVGTYLQD